MDSGLHPLSSQHLPMGASARVGRRLQPILSPHGRSLGHDSYGPFPYASRSRAGNPNLGSMLSGAPSLWMLTKP